MPSAYKIEEFVQACRNGTVIVWDKAMKTARDEFGLQTEQSVREFIAAGGLENPIHHNTRPLEKWKAPPPPPMIDSYKFSSGPKKGYAAFFKSPVTNKWILKSFKKDMQEADLNMPFKNLSSLLLSAEPKDTEESNG